jgi:hypothetical protein
MEYEANYYLNVESPKAIAAGPLSLVALLAVKPLDYVEIQNRDKDLIHYLDELEAAKSLYVVHTYLWPEQIEGQGLQEILSRKVDTVIARLSLMSKIRAKNIYRLSNNIPPSTNYVIKPQYDNTLYKKITNRINLWKRKLLMHNHYDYLYPEYELKKNLGLKTDRHLDLIYLHGPRIDFHYTAALADLPQHWAKKLINVTPNYLAVFEDPTPEWWPRFTRQPFLSKLLIQDQSRVKQLITNQIEISKTFKNFLETYPPLELNDKKRKALPTTEKYVTTYMAKETG